MFYKNFHRKYDDIDWITRVIKICDNMYVGVLKEG